MPEERLTPPEREVDGKYVCDDCGEVIPGGEFCYVVEGKCYCEDCMGKYHYTIAPYVGEG